MEIVWCLLAIQLANQIAVFLVIAFHTCGRMNAEFNSAPARQTGQIVRVIITTLAKGGTISCAKDCLPFLRHSVTQVTYGGHTTPFSSSVPRYRMVYIRLGKWR